MEQDILNLIDDTWQDAMEKPSTNALGCMSDDNYVDTFEQYVQVTNDTSALNIWERMIYVARWPNLSTHYLIVSQQSSNLSPLTLQISVMVFQSSQSPLVLLPSHFNRICHMLMEVCLVLIF